MYECLICREDKDEKDKITLPCKHCLCQGCFDEWEKRSNTCPFCRSVFIFEDPEPEGWLYLDPDEWIVYSRTDNKYGEEKIYVYRRDEPQPSWRNEDLTVPLKRNKRTRRKIKNRNKY